MQRSNTTPQIDIALIGGGIMSATLGTFLKELEPSWSINVYEKLDDVALESSNPWNNAGTGHSALCELNYTPENTDGSVDISKAIDINEKFQVTRQFWSYLVEQGILQNPQDFLNPTTHMSFVWGKDHSNYLEKRYEALKDQKLFEGIEFSQDRDEIANWTPLIIEGRNPHQDIAASRIASGTDVDFGSLTRLLFNNLTQQGVELNLEQEITNIKRDTDGTWLLNIKEKDGFQAQVRAKFIFIGAGGGALHLLQQTGIPEAKGLGGFPVSGQFLKTTNKDLVEQHRAKVYGQAEVDAPPMSVPHLDLRIVDGEKSLLFGPYAGFSTKFLKQGSYLDLPSSLSTHNLYPMIRAGLGNLQLTKYLITEVVKQRKDKDLSLLNFMPTANPEDWELIEAGQRVQVIKKDAKKGGTLQFGTEVVTSTDGTVSALLGASPGASTAPSIILDILQRCFPQEFSSWEPKITGMIPGFKQKLNDNEHLAEEITSHTAKVLGIDTDFSEDQRTKDIN
ncbi:MAG: malate:quinone oxidoreductase [Micrococcaceae bacterium]